MLTTDKLSIKTWAENDRPREKLLTRGRQTLSDAELIAILIGSGSRNESAVDLSRRILGQYGNDLNRLAKLSVSDFMQFNGIGEAKAISIIAALELGRRRKEISEEQKPKISSSADIYETLKPTMLDLPHEEFHILLLNRANKLIAKEVISRGGVAGTVVDSKIVFKLAVQHLASSIVLCHNHPSGNLNPSEQDISLTKKMQEAGRLLDIPVLDHIIFTDTAYFSFADEGIL